MKENRYVVVLAVLLSLTPLVLAADPPTQFAVDGFIRLRNGSGVPTNTAVFLVNSNLSVNVSSATLFPNGFYSTTINGSQNHLLTVTGHNGSHLGDVTILLPSAGGTITEVNGINVSLNAFPEISIPTFNDTSVFGDEDMFVTTVYGDHDGDRGAITLRWFVNGTQAFLETFLNRSNSTLVSKLSATNYSRGSTINVSASAADVFYTISANGLVATIANSLPVASGLLLQPASPKTNNNLSAAHSFSDGDGDGESGSLIEWFKNGVEQSALENVTLISSSNTAEGENWTFRVTPNDGTDFGTAVTSSQVTIGATGPSVTLVSLNDSSVTTLEDVKATATYTDIDGDTGSLLFKWYVNGTFVFSETAGGIATDNSGSSVIASTNYSKGDTLNVSVQANDGGLDSNVVNSNSVTIGNTAPSANSVAVNPAAPKTANSLTASFVYSDVDNDVQSGSSIEWFKNGVAQSALENLTIVGSGNTSKGQNWSFSVTPRDGSLFGILVSSGNVTILNTAPIASGAAVLPPSPSTLDDLDSNFSFSDGDGDGESGSLIEWFKNGVEQAALENLTTVVSSNTAKGQQWNFRVTPRDGTDLGSAVTAANVTIGNSAPRANEFLCNASSGFASCNATEFGNTIKNILLNCTDADDDIVQVKYVLTNLFDSKILLNADNSSTGNNSLFNLFTNTTILDSGSFSVNATCIDASGLSSEASFSWDIAFGNLSPIAISGNSTHVFGTSFNFSTGTACTGGECVNVSALLDPMSTVTLPLVRGWNLISLPLQFPSSALEDVFAPLDGKYDAIASFSSSGVAVFDPQYPSFSDLQQVDPKQGYWIKMKEAATFTVSGTIPSSSSVTLQEGWNLVSVPLQLQSTAISAIRVVPTDAVSGIYRYDALTGEYEGSSVGGGIGISSTGFSNLKQGEGVWVKSNQPASMNFNTLAVGNAKGVMPVSSGSPFYTTSANPQEGGCLASIRPGQFCNQTWTVQVNGTRGTAYEFFTNYSFKVNVSSPLRLISINGLPTVSGVQVSPGSPDTKDNLSAQFTYADGDNDAESGSLIEWFKNGFVQAALENLTTAGAGNTTKGEQWSFSVTPKDGKEFGLPVGAANVTIGNIRPAVTQPVINDSAPKAFEDISASITYTDPDADAGSLTFSWFVNNSNVFNETVSSVNGGSAGSNFSSSNYSKADRLNVSVVANDGTGDSTTRSSGSVVVANTPPSVASVAVSPVSPQTSDTLTATFGFSDTDNDAESGSLIEWFKNGVAQAALQNLTTIAASNTAKGQNWSFRITPKDGEDFGGSFASANVAIGGTKPNVTQPVFNDSSITTLEDVLANSTYGDVDGEVGSLLFRWYVNGTLVFNQTVLNVTNGAFGTSAISGTNYSKGDRLNVSVQSNDGALNSLTVNSDAVTIGNTAPAAASAAVIPGSPVAIDGLTATFVFDDVDNDSESSSFITWFKNGVVQAALENLTTVGFGNTSKGQQWNFKVTPRDGTALGGLVGSANVTIQNSAPNASNLAISPSSPQTSNSLTATFDYSDADTDAESGSRITWFKNGVEQSSLENVTTIGSSNTQQGEKWSFAVTPKDGINFGTRQQGANKTIGSTAPAVTQPTFNDTSLKTFEDVRASSTYTDGDGDSGTLFFRWFVNNTNVFSQTVTIIANGDSASSNFSSSNYSKADEVNVSVTASDGALNSSTRFSDVNIVGNTAPSASGALVLPAVPRVTLNLSANFSFADIDADGQSGSLIEWFRNGVEQASLENQSTIDKSNIAEGEKWSFSVTPRDGVDFGSRISSANATILNSAPTATVPSLNDSSVQTFEDIRASSTFNDADGESGTLRFSWFVNNSPVFNESVSNVASGGVGTSRLVSSNFVKGSILKVDVVANDGSVDSGVSSSAERTVINTQPSAASAAVAPSVPETGDNLLANFVFSDVDNDVQAGSLIEWFKNGVAQSSLENLSTVVAANTAEGQRWSFSVTPRDGVVFGSRVASANVTIGTTAPTVTQPTFNDTSLLTFEDVQANITYSDVDGDAGNVTFTWRVNNIIVKNDTKFQIASGGVVRSNLSSTNYNKSDTINVSVIGVSDGISSLAQVSDTITVGNAAPEASNLAIDPISPKTADSLTANFTFADIDNDAQSNSEIKWFKNGVVQSSLENITTIDSSNTAKEQNWSFALRPKDGTDFGVLQESTNVTIGNSAPNLKSPVLNDSFPRSNEDISISTNYTDSDGDQGSLLFIWFNFSNFFVKTAIFNESFSTVPSGSIVTSHLSASNYSKGDRIIVEIFASDGENTSGASSFITTVFNTLPVVIKPAFNNTSPNQKQDIAVNTTYADFDGDNGTISFQWFINNANVFNETKSEITNGSVVTSMLSFTNTSIGDQVNVSVVANDGGSNSNLVFSDTITIIAQCNAGEKRNCNNQVGVCNGAQETCNNGAFTGCTDAIFLAHNSSFNTTEGGCDGLDNDCDGTTDETGSSFCADGLFCNGVEVCNGAAGCGAGTVVSCTGNDVSLISTCNNNPDNIAATFDFRAAFTSVCVEATDSCSTGSTAVASTCNSTACGAACEAGQTNDTGIRLCSGGNVVTRIDGCSGSCTFADNVAADTLTQTCELGCSNGRCLDDDDAPAISNPSPASSDVAINEGDSQTFSVTVVDPDGKPFSYFWSLDGTIVSSRPTFTYDTDFNDAGVRRVTVTVANDRYATNHTWSVTVNDVVVANKSDLVVEDLALFFPSNPVQGGLTLFQFVIKNIGVQGANNFRWRLNTGEGTFDAPTDVSVAAGASLQVTAPKIYGSSGTKTVTATADIAGAVDELFETNNQESINVTIS